MSTRLLQHLLCKESHWTINEGEVKLLDMGIKPIISRTRMGRRSEETEAHAHRNLMPLLEQLQAYKVTAYNTRHQRGRKLSVGGVITPSLCSWSSTGQEKVYSTRLDGHQVLQDQPPH
ncbi:unnamed protein product [Microthlaspi erraticum]|uniref:Arabidopsis retrotransposon Orf1 C-terminal domain-containing protein n=1 Tax=Microthlaspi erraticum TaxID=1685480 RepID=A0A6D2K176_9BRAS|nr:unnamed protein product [Microthlaspi erraticum]